MQRGRKSGSRARLFGQGILGLQVSAEFSRSSMRWLQKAHHLGPMVSSLWKSPVAAGGPEQAVRAGLGPSLKEADGYWEENARKLKRSQDPSRWRGESLGASSSVTLARVSTREEGLRPRVPTCSCFTESWLSLSLLGKLTEASGAAATQPFTVAPSSVQPCPTPTLAGA